MRDAPHSFSTPLWIGLTALIGAAVGAGCAADAPDAHVAPDATSTPIPAQTSAALDATESANLDVASKVADLAAGRCPTARIFAPGVISTPASEGRLVLTADGQTAYFHRFLANENRLVVFESRRDPRRDVWSEPVAASFSNTAFNDFDPFVTLDGKYIYFSSDRPTDGGSTARPDWEIWRAPRTRTGWGAPVHLGPEVNTPDNELFPSTTDDGTLYFNSDRQGGFGAWDIYHARRKGSGFEPAVNAGPGINTANWEFNPMPSPDGRFIFFGSIGRTDSFGGADIYTSVKRDGQWLPSKNAGPCINTAQEEFHPSFAWARGSLLFVRSATPEDQGDAYELTFGR
ncbi:TolB family protein [Pendulispora albinea]|uniref:WD40 repeat protein n=1 Tax=Pendulispora albinea TaxID=2741071 RepID=A0ABZ2LSL7_9BACT